MPHLTINGRSQFVDTPDDTPLLWAIREEPRFATPARGRGRRCAPAKGRNGTGN